MKKALPLNNFANPPAAGVANKTTLQIPSGIGLHGIELEGYAGAALKMAGGFDTVKLKLGQRTQREFVLSELDRIHGLLDQNNLGVQGDAAPGGTFRFPICFSEWFRKQYGAAEAHRLDIPAGMDAQLEVSSLAAVTAGTFLRFYGEYEDLATIPLAARRWQTLPDGRTLPKLLKMFRRVIVVGATNTANINDLTRQDLLQLLSFSDPAGTTIDQVTIVKDGVLIHDLTKAQQDVALLRKQLNPSAGYYDIVPDASDNEGDSWDLNSSGQFDVKLTFAGNANAGASIVVNTWRYGLPE